MNYNLLSYTIYIPITIIVMIWIGQNLFKHGHKFLSTVIESDFKLVKSLNAILIWGFYLFNFGYAFLSLNSWEEMNSVFESFTSIVYMLGRIMFILACMHYFNLFWILVYFNYKKSKNLNYGKS